ncbi:hypothetical protein LUQ84_3544 [Hamiltosporidium tvaerminnensis]|nr:hypothetical protein LUQ84_3544 [Hamiltosporidium tvaerminnensis]
MFRIMKTYSQEKKTEYLFRVLKEQSPKKLPLCDIFLDAVAFLISFIIELVILKKFLNFYFKNDNKTKQNYFLITYALHFVNLNLQLLKNEEISTKYKHFIAKLLILLKFIFLTLVTEIYFDYYLMEYQCVFSWILTSIYCFVSILFYSKACIMLLKFTVFSDEVSMLKFIKYLIVLYLFILIDLVVRTFFSSDLQAFFICKFFSFFITLPFIICYIEKRINGKRFVFNLLYYVFLMILLDRNFISLIFKMEMMNSNELYRK